MVLIIHIRIIPLNPNRNVRFLSIIAIPLERCQVPDLRIVNPSDFIGTIANYFRHIVQIGTLGDVNARLALGPLLFAVRFRDFKVGRDDHADAPW